MVIFLLLLAFSHPLIISGNTGFAGLAGQFGTARGSRCLVGSRRITDRTHGSHWIFPLCSIACHVCIHTIGGGLILVVDFPKDSRNALFGGGGVLFDGLEDLRAWIQPPQIPSCFANNGQSVGHVCSRSIVNTVNRDSYDIPPGHSWEFTLRRWSLYSTVKSTTDKSIRSMRKHYLLIPFTTSNNNNAIHLRLFIITRYQFFA